MNRSRSAGVVLVTVLLLCGFKACDKTTHNLAVASDAISHALADAQSAVQQGVQAGTISQADASTFNSYIAKVAQAGLVIDQGIRANEKASNLSAQVNSFLDAFNALQQQGLAGISNPALKLTLSTIITGAESSVAIIAASVGK